MRTLKSILTIAAFVIFSVSLSNAANILDGEKTLSEQVQSYIKYPKSGYEDGLEGKVFVVYSITIDNTIKVETLISPNDELKDYVKNSIDGKIVMIENNNPEEQHALSVVFEFVD